MYIQQSVYGCLMVVYRFGIQLPPPPLSPRVVWSKLSPPFVFPVTSSALAPPLVFSPWIYGRGWSVGPLWIGCRWSCGGGSGAGVRRKGWTRGAYPPSIFPSFTSSFTSCLMAQKKGARIGSPLLVFGWCGAAYI